MIVAKINKNPLVRNVTSLDVYSGCADFIASFTIKELSEALVSKMREDNYTEEQIDRARLQLDGDSYYHCDINVVTEEIETDESFNKRVRQYDEATARRAAVNRTKDEKEFARLKKKLGKCDD